MKEITMFQANDGKMFDYEDECRGYELGETFRCYNKDIALYDYEGNEIKINNFYGDYIELNDMLNDAYLIKANSADALEALIDLFCEYGIDVGGLEWDGNPDIFIYGDLCPGGYSGEWNSWNERVEVMRSFKTNYIDKVKGDD